MDQVPEATAGGRRFIDRFPTLARWAHRMIVVSVSAAAASAPLYLVFHANSGTANNAELIRVGQGRSIIGAELVEVQVSEGFEELSELVALAPEPPPWQAVRRLMEDRGWEGVSYSLRVLSLLDDGGLSEVLYTRTPFHDARPATEEFLRLLAVAHGRIAGDQVRLPHCEVDLRPDRINASAPEVLMLLLNRMAPE